MSIRTVCCHPPVVRFLPSEEGEFFHPTSVSLGREGFITVKSPDSFVTENPYPSFDRDNTLAEDFKIHRITSKYWYSTTYSTTEERHNAYTINEQLDTGAKVYCTNLKYIINNYKPYKSKF